LLEWILKQKSAIYSKITARRVITAFMVLGLVGSSGLNPKASLIELVAVLNLLPRPISLSRRSSVGEVTISSESSIAEDDSLGGGYDQENRRERLGSGAARGGDPLAVPKSVEKDGFCENEARRLGGGGGTGPGFSVPLSFREVMTLIQWYPYR
jgi:hypothetical protein